MTDKKKKLESNRFEDALKDYARTNSAYTDENNRKMEGKDSWKSPINRGEKVMIVIGVLALLGCVIKYVIL